MDAQIKKSTYWSYSTSIKFQTQLVKRRKESLNFQNSEFDTALRRRKGAGEQQCHQGGGVEEPIGGGKRKLIFSLICTDKGQQPP